MSTNHQDLAAVGGKRWLWDLYTKTHPTVQQLYKTSNSTGIMWKNDNIFIYTKM